MLQQKLKLQDWTNASKRKKEPKRRHRKRDPLVCILTQESYNTKLETIIYKQKTWYRHAGPGHAAAVYVSSYELCPC